MRHYLLSSPGPHRTRRTPKARSALLGAVALAALVTTAGGVALPAFAQAPQTIVAPQSTVPSFADVVERVKPAVVSVRAKAGDAKQAQVSGDRQTSPNFNLPDFGLPDDHPFQEFFKRFRGEGGRDSEAPRFGRPGPRQGISQGSGFFISADGYLVTNNHVIDKSSEVEVLMDDGRTLPAKVVGTDPKTDLALLKVEEGGPFKFVELAPEVPRVGDWVLAVGNPFGLGGTVTAGIVSARARDIGAGPYDDFLQIDAPVNRGNSGGPTFNQKGQVVGVNTAIASPSGGNVGIAFAIPSETVRNVVTQLREKGAVERGYVGVQIQPVTKDIAASVGLDRSEGAIVARVEDGGPAAKAGIKTGDVIISVNGKPVEDARDLSRMIASLNAGSTATLQVWRDGKRQEIPVTIAKMSGTSAAAADPQQGTEMGKLGLNLAPAGNNKTGVAVVGVEPGSPAAEKGFSTGDVIKEVAGQPVQTPADVKAALEASRKDGKKSVLFLVEASGGTRFVALQVPAA
ncbi:Do family serine endopeptidase [Microvirga arabica]|uniref:Do family serine endopeptidase n=1 Tax=Microvirga arabica TaxID=1128671 RepID=UPI00193AB9E3|nr:Do family serine endopeptidase [Microvirga arabica]MBM1170016.1 Do family serine endopeptidase [Microvirga arabica]